MKLKHLILFLAVVVAGCSMRRDVPGVEGAGDGPCVELCGIDSLMWRQPDSALMALVDFAATPKADSLSAFEGHYCQVLISELLYKNYYAQSNRAELLQAVGYFDSIVGTDGADARGASLRASSSSRLRRLSGRSKTVGLVSFLLILGLRWYVFRRQRYLLKASILLHKSLSWSWVIILNKVFRAAQVGKNVVIAANSLFLSL